MKKHTDALYILLHEKSQFERVEYCLIPTIGQTLKGKSTAGANGQWFLAVVNGEWRTE